LTVPPGAIQPPTYSRKSRAVEEAVEWIIIELSAIPEPLERKSAGQAQRFLSAHDQINNLFRLRRDHISAAEHRASRTQTLQVWAEICSLGWQ
jgi:hypothetical protein